MIIIEKIKINDVPILHIVAKESYDQPLPFIQFIHGFTSAKEHNLHFAYNLAEKGFRIVLPDALYHGEREANLSGMQLNMQFWDIVLQTIEDIEHVKHYFEAKGLIQEDKIGLVGTSMGGIVTLGALSRYPWINTAVCLMGMPYYEKFANYTIQEVKKRGYELPLSEEEIDRLLKRLGELDLSKQPEKLENRPLLFWHGKKDETVPYMYSRQFYETILPLYEETPEKLSYITEEHTGHKVSRKAMLRTIEWFEEFLQNQASL
ncbi:MULTISPECIES: alpha/beta fold hydrolase [Bacillaceae]|uniref:alpha/beta fold hydrolase n=1 Tax=Bacillaceae TaxID=186817 RepID=UPI001E57514D|nr:MULTISPECIES: alpha/beta fold hydrolase [Bacillaceae]MCE4050442.1 alpha/beta hydrolase [Bacillus sp. Au-Bac7]MCM3030463.1 alpha/beta hydrolase [Niallia sp. MER 6]